MLCKFYASFLVVISTICKKISTLQTRCFFFKLSSSSASFFHHGVGLLQRLPLFTTSHSLQPIWALDPLHIRPLTHYFSSLTRLSKLGYIINIWDSWVYIGMLSSSTTDSIPKILSPILLFQSYNICNCRNKKHDVSVVLFPNIMRAKPQAIASVE